MEESRSAFKTLTGKPTRNRPLGRPICKWEDNIRMDVKETDRQIKLIRLRVITIGEPL